MGPEECSHVINSLSTRVARRLTICHSRLRQSTRFYSYLESTYCCRNLRIDREGRPSFIPSSTNIFPLPYITVVSPQKEQSCAYRVVSKQLTKFKSNPNGSFIEKFELLNPVQFTTHNGSFGGYWITLASEAIFQYETAIVWSAYACSTGHPQRMCTYYPSRLFENLHFKC